MKESLEKKIAWMYLDNDMDNARKLCVKLPKDNLVRKIIEKRYKDIEYQELHPGERYWTGPSDIQDFQKFKIARSIIADIVKDKKEVFMLDIGCLNGSFLMSIVKEFPTIFGYGVDIINQAMSNYESKINNLNCDFFNMRAQDISNIWNKKFDIITAFDVLEHVLDDNATIEAMENVAKDGGTIIINLPKIVREKRSDDYLKIMLERKPEHLRKYTLKYILNKFGKKNGFKMFPCKDERGDDSYFFTYTI